MLTYSRETLKVLSLSLEPEMVTELTSQTNSQLLEVWGDPEETCTIESTRYIHRLGWRGWASGRGYQEDRVRNMGKKSWKTGLGETNQPVTHWHGLLPMELHWDGGRKPLCRHWVHPKGFALLHGSCLQELQSYCLGVMCLCSFPNTSQAVCHLPCALCVSLFSCIHS